MTTQSIFPHFENDPEDINSSDQKRELEKIFLGELRRFPNICPNVRSANAKFIGAAGEYLVDSILARHGLRVWTAPDLHCADRLIDLARHSLLIQVKAVTSLTHGIANFSMQHGNGRAGNQRLYSSDAFDIAALVVLSHNAVKFVPNLGRSFRIYEAELPTLLADPVESLEFSISTILQRRSQCFC